MTINFSNLTANNVCYRGEQQAPLSKPIAKVQNSIENSMNTINAKVDKEKEKKSNKKAVSVTLSVLVLSGIVALLNPKFSNKLIEKIKLYQQQNASNNGWFFKLQNGAVKLLEFSNNFNSAKDVCFKWMCTSKKSFDNVKNKTLKKILTTIDSGFVKVMKKPHELITKWFDKISKKTVLSKYKKADKSLDKLENTINQYLSKLNPQERAQVESILQEARGRRAFLSPSLVEDRLKQQEQSMSNLTEQVQTKFKDYTKGFFDKNTNKTAHFKDNYSFWAQDMMQASRDTFEANGKRQIERIISNPNENTYKKVLDILSPKLSTAEKNNLQKYYDAAEKRLLKANNTECVQYFDKKRDLVLGGAPTDILTAVLSLGASGIAISTADNKDERISRALTLAGPVVLGLGASMAFTARLFSGVQGMIYGGLTSAGLSKLGTVADHYYIKKQNIKEALDA